MDNFTINKTVYMGQGALHASQQPDDLSTVMFIFKLFQSGLIFTALVAGVICVGHVVFVRRKNCRNTTTLFAVMLSGFLHMIACVCMLTISEKYTTRLANLGHLSAGSCMDYSMTAALANAVVLVFIVHNIFVQNFKWSVCSCLAYAVTLGSIVTGSVFILKIVPQNSQLPVAQQSLVTLGTAGSQHVEVFWSVCQKNAHEERWALLTEYVLIYLPVIVTVLVALCINKTKQTEVDTTELRILSNIECNVPGLKCDCVQLNTAMVAVLIYSAIVLLMVRPGYIMYAYATSGYFRDILPSLLQTVMFTFICSEYIGKVLIRPQYCNNEVKSSCNCDCEHMSKPLMDV
ncbi:hypothetical protein MAR_015945 [Mya arenaria]|uniref:G-protein coupled receptors family 1 profile domain-containing protein n=1 Tax=Mya arenaria TaxID=6604 RepID=A0ABY7FRZ0_MYAAR|nr:uncharacterized protein LOC128210278 [Mya arenaria]WAR21971.1 hypothetical protein MAR_015945 [Mya arenaria]